MKYMLVLEGTHYLYKNSLRKTYICMPPAFSTLGVLESLEGFPFYFIIRKNFGDLGGFEIFALCECYVNTECLKHYRLGSQFSKLNICKIMSLVGFLKIKGFENYKNCTLVFKTPSLRLLFCLILSM